MPFVPLWCIPALLNPERHYYLFFSFYFLLPLAGITFPLTHFTCLTPLPPPGHLLLDCWGWLGCLPGFLAHAEHPLTLAIHIPGHTFGVTVCLPADSALSTEGENHHIHCHPVPGTALVTIQVHGFEGRDK